MSEQIKKETNDVYIENLSKRKGARVVSWICLFIIAFLIIATLVTGILGSKLFMGFLVLMIIVPFMMYVVLWIGRLISDSRQDK